MAGLSARDHPPPLSARPHRLLRSMPSFLVRRPLSSARCIPCNCHTTLKSINRPTTRAPHHPSQDIPISKRSMNGVQSHAGPSGAIRIERHLPSRNVAGNPSNGTITAPRRWMQRVRPWFKCGHHPPLLSFDAVKRQTTRRHHRLRHRHRRR